MISGGQRLAAVQRLEVKSDLDAVKVQLSHGTVVRGIVKIEGDGTPVPANARARIFPLSGITQDQFTSPVKTDLTFEDSRTSACGVRFRPGGSSAGLVREVGALWRSGSGRRGIPTARR